MKALVNYQSYLAIEELLSLQRPVSDPPEHDEQLFIIIHQVYELWFKLTMHELTKLYANLYAGELYQAISTLKRVRMVMKTLVSQLDVLETMTPMSFASFRDRLDTASGFQSVQFRAFEFFMGYKRPEMLKHYEGSPAAMEQLQRRLAEPSIMDAFYRFLVKRGVTVPQECLERDVTQPTQANAVVQDSLIEIYRTQADAAILLELMTDYDEGLQEWRYRHVKMVERTIGHKIGTGGSLGVKFLQGTLFKPLFPDLWEIRHRL